MRLATSNRGVRKSITEVEKVVEGVVGMSPDEIRESSLDIAPHSSLPSMR